VASHKSAIKAHRQNVKRRERNRRLRSRLRGTLKAIRTTIETGTPSRDDLGSAVATIDRMAGKGVVHRNTAARYKSRLAKQLARKSAGTPKS
jgi:small subunit ribosomal protein S20